MILGLLLSILGLGAHMGSLLETVLAYSSRSEMAIDPLDRLALVPGGLRSHPMPPLAASLCIELPRVCAGELGKTQGVK